MSTSEEKGLDRAAAASSNGTGGRVDFQTEIRGHRLAKLQALRQRGVEPYPVRYDRDATAGELQREFAGLAAGVYTSRVVRLAGRLLAERRHGGLDFADLRDETGAIQLMITRDQVGEQKLRDFSDLDLGDWIGVQGTVVASERGELSIRVADFQLLSKRIALLYASVEGFLELPLLGTVLEPPIRQRMEGK
ncbi:MAG: hypothetical protein JOY58_13670 [Solirubrobacterales bacterium]|nr:hypothetical protein [Solirubrobacterales bacterium]